MNKPWITEEEHARIVAYADALLAGAEFFNSASIEGLPPTDEKPLENRIGWITKEYMYPGPHEKPAPEDNEKLHFTARKFIATPAPSTGWSYTFAPPDTYKRDRRDALIRELAVVAFAYAAKQPSIPSLPLHKEVIAFADAILAESDKAGGE